MADNWNELAISACGRDFGSDFGFHFGNPFKAIRSIGKTLSGGIESIGNKLDKVPVVGKGLHGVYSVATGPISLSAHIASGDRIDHAVMNDFKRNLHAAKDVAPYAQTVVSFVPGVGQGISGAIGAASALAQGRPIGEAMLAAVKSSLPGGPLAKGVFDTALAAAQGKPIDEIAIAALPIPDDQKKIVRQGLAVVNDVAHGKRLDHVLVDNALKALPPEYQKVVSTGIALGHAKNLQDIMKTGAKEAMPGLAEIGLAKINEDPVLSAGLNTLDSDARSGYKLAAGLSNYKVNPTEFNSIRGRLTPQQKEGFDIASSVHIGRLAKQLPRKIDPKARFGYYAALGMKNAKPANQIAMKQTLGKDSVVSHGMHVARQHIEQGKDLKHATIWQRIVHLLTGK